VDKGRNKFGQELYVASCGICHDAEHRASAVPNLHALQHDTNADYWKTWISQGKPGSMMPAFSTSQGGPLSDAQIASLVQYLTATIPAQAQHAKN
jgi:mono/diheme cytochrome c family protein